MSPATAFQAQLASIMEVLANTAVAEICELVDSGYTVLQLEISRNRKENEVLRRKLRLMELRAARVNALRAAASGGLLHASGRPRVHLLAGNEPRRSGTQAEAALSRLSNQETSRCRDPSPPPDSGQEATQQTPAGEETAVVIKVEDEEPWSRSESDRQTPETETSSSQVKQEAAAADDRGGVLSGSWTSGEVSSTSTQNSLNTSQETRGFDCLMFELQHGSRPTQNPPGGEPGCSSALNRDVGVSADSGGGSFSFSLCNATLSAAEQPAGFNQQQRAPPPAAEPAQKEPADGRSALMHRNRWRLQERLSRQDAAGKTFVCNRCGKTLACLKNLKTHMRVHTGEKPFVCMLCGKRFSDSSNLKRHQSVHTGEKRYGCVHCGKRFAQSGSLKVHMSVHTDCKQFRCSFCGKTFISGSHLRRHITVHAGEKRFAAELP
ncbi:uncharacterized protein [Leuresthes tenuis]|uniref:uncharacterized protein isoform X2 n=1 Tax=Leuresthes tenuis TaxID=355514 RepID=UPI003B511B0D